MRLLVSAAYGSLCLALFALPFEPIFGVTLAGLTLTPVEILIGVAFALWLGVLIVERRRPYLPHLFVIAAGILLFVLLVAALLADDARGGALKFVLRQAQGVALAFCLADWLRRTPPVSADALMAALLAGVTVSAGLGLWEMTESPAALAATAPFKDAGSYMGGLLRLSGSFSYANTAAMYYEALLPLALVTAVRGGRHRLAIGVALLLVPAILFTYSRAALVVTLLLIVATPLLIAWMAGRAAARAMVRLSMLPLAVLVLIILTQPLVWLRLLEPDVARWYGAQYVPSAIGSMAPNEVRLTPILLENRGRIAWTSDSSRPVRLAYHWLDAESRRVVHFEGRRTVLPEPVAPGAVIELGATVQAPPQPGRYILAWDMVREHIGRGWFSQMGIPVAEVPVLVTGPPLPPPSGSAVDPPDAPQTLMELPGPPGRRILWTTALQMWAEQPLFGIGPDVFRHTYGSRLGLPLWDDRVHTNNLYLELLVGAGLLALPAFLAVCVLALRAGLALQTHPADRAALAAGALLGLGAFLVHGLLDVFLAFTPTYGLLWALIGILAGSDKHL